MITCGETGHACLKPHYWCADRCDLKARRERKEPMNPTEQNLSELRRVTPVAWRWRYVRADGKVHWVVSQAPRYSVPARRDCVEIVAEPLYAEAALQSAQQRADTLEAENKRLKAFDVLELMRSLEWALDLLDIYDAELLRRGEDVNKLLPELHIEAKMRARSALKAKE